MSKASLESQGTGQSNAKPYDDIHKPTMMEKAKEMAVDAKDKVIEGASSAYEKTKEMFAGAKGEGLLHNDDLNRNDIAYDKDFVSDKDFAKNKDFLKKDI